MFPFAVFFNHKVEVVPSYNVTGVDVILLYRRQCLLSGLILNPFRTVCKIDHEANNNLACRPSSSGYCRKPLPSSVALSP